MAEKASGATLQKLAALDEAKRKWDRVHGLVEKAATQPDAHEAYLRQCQRAAQDVGRVLTTHGFGLLAGAVDQVSLVMRRGGDVHAKIRGLREVVGTVFTGLERAERGVRSAESPKPD